MNAPKQTPHLKQRIRSEGKKFVKIVGYLWVVLSLFDIHALLVLRQQHLDSRFGITMGANLFKALVLGKVILLGDSLHLGEHFRHKALIYSILFKGVVFSVLLLCFNTVEELVKGVAHGERIAQSVAELGGAELESKALVGAILFIVLIPLFAFAEIRRVLGDSAFHALMFEDRKADATHSVTR